MTAHGGNVETVIVLGNDTSGSGRMTGCVSSCVLMARVNRDISLDICNKKHEVVMSRYKKRYGERWKTKENYESRDHPQYRGISRLI